MTEMTKLIVLLAKNDIPFEVRGFNISDGKYKASVQVHSPNAEHTLIDAVSHIYSYGGELGLIEILSSAVEGDGVVGSLTAEEAFKYFKEVSTDE